GRGSPPYYLAPDFLHKTPTLTSSTFIFHPEKTAAKVPPHLLTVMDHNVDDDAKCDKKVKKEFLASYFLATYRDGNLAETMYKWFMEDNKKGGNDEM
ncbi:hypothetical protein M8C21_010981, partial [Ambrosia artemisiifolia]